MKKSTIIASKTSSILGGLGSDHQDRNKQVINKQRLNNILSTIGNAGGEEEEEGKRASIARTSNMNSSMMIGGQGEGMQESFQNRSFGT